MISYLYVKKTEHAMFFKIKCVGITFFSVFIVKGVIFLLVCLFIFVSSKCMNSLLSNTKITLQIWRCVRYFLPN